jgi:hypothetical protein
LDPLSFIAKLIGVTARVGAVFALSALCLYIGRRAGVEFFINLDPVIFQTIIVAGIVGVCSVVVELARGAWLVLETLLPVYREHRISKRTALRNLAIEALPPECADVLRFLKSNNIRRFLAPNYNEKLEHMKSAGLLQVDDPNWSAYANNTYYVVPDYIWSRIDHGWLKSHPLPSSPPWTFPR